MNSSLGTCVLCGERPAVGQDHLPPSTVFPKPRPDDPVLVPSCGECNSGSSVQDQAFAAYLSLLVGLRRDDTKQLWQKHIRPTIRSNRKLGRKILSQLDEVLISTPAGLVHSRGHRMTLDHDIHDSVIERMIRGYYYHEFGAILGRRVTCEIQCLGRLTPDISEFSNRLRQASVGGDALIYRFGRADDEPLRSVWIFQFYCAHWSSGVTVPGNAT